MPLNRFPYVDLGFVQSLARGHAAWKIRNVRPQLFWARSKITAYLTLISYLPKLPPAELFLEFHWNVVSGVSRNRHDIRLRSVLIMSAKTKLPGVAPLIAAVISAMCLLTRPQLFVLKTSNAILRPVMFCR